MAGGRNVRDSRLIDALEALPASAFSGTVWRVVREGRDPCQCAASGGRWDDGSFDVLYTSTRRDGALSEMYFHLSRGQPVFPARLRFKLYELTADLSPIVSLPTLADLAGTGVDTAHYRQLHYDSRHQEYPRTQELAGCAHVLDFQGMLVPGARMDCPNLVLFCAYLTEASVRVKADHGIIDWSAWRAGQVPS
nr:RES family NAD+ phosphorylase [uncultured Gellertiella sp.]